jgi:hypothetical protein
MLAAILQKEAQGHALDNAEVTCHRMLDQAHALAVRDDPGDARGGHGSFCTPGYLEMQRGGCWLTLGHPGKAVISFHTALQTLPPVYRRDLGVAHAGMSTALVAEGEPEQAAQAALKALEIAQDSGSTRILNMVTSVGSRLAAHGRLEPVAELRAALAETPAV